ncbi:MAG: hypothetical protein QNJ70_20070 [Xenococcaceae cyanobacterium MO_207.B15]|nr:hypothetical protein [Xenococcaceae cyanobacterium MO_207.B15]MDJ0745320.1 hypothetical protein [Xenococcaceae cyanobacterium MO_167.B27]
MSSIKPIKINQEQEQSYRNLICDILTYPNRAALILDANEHLLDPGLMQVMEQVATSMAANNAGEAASFLQNLRYQLKDELTNTVIQKASLASGQEREIDRVDNEEELSKGLGLALFVGKILFIVMVLL